MSLCSAALSATGSFADCNFCHFAANAITVQAQAIATATIIAVWIPSTYARRMNGKSVGLKTFRMSVAPVPMTVMGLMDESEARSFFVRSASKALSPAETRNAPPMV